MIADTAELPTEIQKLVAKVVRRTRLRKAERADIERELTAHFRDGLEAGKSVAQLIEAFGETRVSARSIRAGAIAKRSPLDRALRQASFAVGWAFVACIALYAASLGYLWMNEPVIRFDALERYHAALPKVAEQDRAWPIYKQGLIALADTAEDKSSGHYPWGSRRSDSKGLAFHSYDEERVGEEWVSALPNQPSWAHQSKVLRERRAGIDAIVRAASMPVLGFVPGYGNNVEDADIGYDHQPSPEEYKHRSFTWVLLPNLMILGHASRFLGADALMSIEDGDGDRFVRDIEAMIRISHHAEEGQLVVSQNSGTRIRDRAFTRVIMGLEWRPETFNGDQLKRLAELLESIPPSNAELDLTMEPWMMQDFVQHAYTDNGAGDGVFNPVYGAWYVRQLQFDDFYFDESLVSMDRSVYAPTSAVRNASRKEVTDLYDLMMQKTREQAQRPLWQQDFSFESEIMRTLWGDGRRNDWGVYYGKRDVSGPSKWAIPRLLLHAYGRVTRTRTLGRGQLDAARVAVAIVRYRRAHWGAWPARLDELVPAYLDAVPPDPWTGKPINYELRDGRPYVWSVGMRQVTGNEDGEGKNSDWKNVADTEVSKPWLWFRGDDKLERWKPKE